MSSVAAPDSAAPHPSPGAPSPAPARAARRLPPQLPPGLSAPLTTLGVAALLCAVAFGAGGSARGAETATEIVLLLAGSACVAAALLCTPRAAAERGPLPGVIAIALFALLAVWTALSISWAINPDDAWLVANRTFAYLAAFAGAAALARVAPERWASVIGGTVLALTIVCGYALLTKMLPRQLNSFELFARLREPFGYWNAVGLAGALAVPGCLWLGSRREGAPALNALAYPALGVCLAATLMAYSRGALLAAMIGTGLWFVLVPLRLRAATVLITGGFGALLIAVWAFGKDALSIDRAPLDDRAAAGGELVVLAVAVVLLLFVAGLVAGFVADAKPLRNVSRRRMGIALLVCLALTPALAAGALTTTEKGLGGSIDSAWKSLTDPNAVGPANDPSRLTATGSVRSRYWDEALQMWKTEKLRGLGAGGYATARPLYRKDLLDVRHAHGYVVEQMAELGLVGLAVSLALLAAWLLAARTSLRSARGPERAALATLLAVTVTFGVHSLIDWTWAVPGVAVVGLLAAGWVAGRGSVRVARVRPALRGAALRAAWPRVAAAGGVAVLALAASWTVFQPLRADHATDDALAALQAGRLAEAEARIVRARELNPLSIEPLLDQAAIESRAGRKDAAERALVQAVELQPQNWLPWMRLTDFRLFELKQPEAAMRSVRVAIYLNPRSWDVAQRYLDVSRRLGKS